MTVADSLCECGPGFLPQLGGIEVPALCPLVAKGLLLPFDNGFRPVPCVTMTGGASVGAEETGRVSWGQNKVILRLWRTRVLSI